MPTTTKYDLYFIARDGRSAHTITTRALGRNQDGVMEYESPTNCFNRACGLIDLKKYKFDGAKAFKNKV